MQRLRDLGNTIVVVEHEEAVIRAADHLIDIGPGRGEDGGHLVYAGPGAHTAAQAKPLAKQHPDALTLQYLSGSREIEVPKIRRKPKYQLTIKRATQHNLKKVDVDLPLGVLCCVTGVSGSGKSTLIHSVLYGNLMKQLGLSGADTELGSSKGVHGVERVREVVMVDQAPLAKTPRSTPAVYTGIFEPIRKLLTATCTAMCSLPRANHATSLPAIFPSTAARDAAPAAWAMVTKKWRCNFSAIST